MNHPAMNPPQRSNSRRRWGFAVLGLAVALTGCRAAPPRYQTTWQRITSPCYAPAIPYCHGYTPTHWSRWPEECQQQEYMIVEEVPHPHPAPAPVEPPMVAPPLAPLPPRIDGPPEPVMPDAQVPPSELPDVPESEPPLIVPQSFVPPPAPQEVDEPTRQIAPKRSPKQASTWTSHLQSYFSAVTKVR